MEKTQVEGTKKEGTEKAPEQAAAAASPVAKPQAQEPSKRPRREERNRKDDRSYDMFLKAINAAPAAEQLNIATQKYLAMLDENKKMQFYIKQSDKRHVLVLKEKETLQLELNKAILLKSKLENLCRELQKQNKSIKEESLHKIREEEERRKETQAKFQNTLAEISTLLQQNNEKNAKLRDDNISMTEKFKTVVLQYQIREDQVEKISKQMELESQLHAAKLQKTNLEHQAARERLMAEMEILKSAVVEYRSKINEMAGTETGLRSQLAVYTDKYDEFQSALMKSNQVFGGFKDQMEKMSKKIKKLEKESLSWKQRWESSQSALLEMCGERQTADTRLIAIQRQLAHMQSLCRTLQAERTVLLGTLKEHHIERPPLPAPAPAPLESPAPITSSSDDKVDAMAANCAQLRQSLAHLQTQLNVLSVPKTSPAPPTEEPAPVEKPKKNKNKRNKTKKVQEETIEVKETPEEQTDKIDNEEVASTSDAVESVDLAVEKVDETVLESLMQAINIANVNLCDMEVVNDNEITIEEVLDSKAKLLEVTDNVENKVTDNGNKTVSPETVKQGTDDVETKVTDNGDKTESPETVKQVTGDVESKVTANGDTDKIEIPETVTQVTDDAENKVTDNEDKTESPETVKQGTGDVESKVTANGDTDKIEIPETVTQVTGEVENKVTDNGDKTESPETVKQVTDVESKVTAKGDKVKIQHSVMEKQELPKSPKKVEPAANPKSPKGKSPKVSPKKVAKVIKPEANDKINEIVEVPENSTSQNTVNDTKPVIPNDANGVEAQV